MHHILHIFSVHTNVFTLSILCLLYCLFLLLLKEHTITEQQVKKALAFCNVVPAASYVCCIIHEHMTPVSVLQNYFFLHRS